MDISKLPRLSGTGTPTNPPPAEAGVPAEQANAPEVPTAQAAMTFCNACGAANPASSQFCGGCGAELRPPIAIDYAGTMGGPGIGAEVWLSAILGIVLMLFGMSFARWAVTSMTGGSFHTNVNWTTGPNDGQEVGYWDLEGFTALQDCAIFLFGLAMVLEAAVLAVVHSRIRRKRPLLFFALTITLIATLLNLVVAGKLMAVSVLPLLSLLCVGFGGYIAAYEWRLLKYFRPLPARPT